MLASAALMPALLLQLAAAAACHFLTGSTEASLVVLVIGVGAVLVAASFTDPPARRSDPPAKRSDGNGAAVEPLLEIMGDPLLVLVDNRVASANAAARELLGPDIDGKDIRLLIRHPDAAERLSDPKGAASASELPGLGGADRRWRLRIGAVVDGRRLIQLSDESASHAAERMRTDFVANASHELRTPLASVIGYAETLLDETAGSDPPTRQRFLAIIAAEAARMQRLVADLLSLSRIEADRHRLPEDSVDLHALAREVVAVFAVQGVAGGRLTVEGGNVPPVAGDRAQLSQLLHNLIGNAVKYGRPETPVTVGLTASRQNVHLTVTDQGEGIPAEHLPRLTERFYRVDAGRSRALGGTGLGLAIVKHIVERHRGRLEITSRTGEGTTVSVRLPIARSAPADARVIKA